MNRGTTQLTADVSQTLIDLAQSAQQQLSANLQNKLNQLRPNATQQILLSEEEVERLLDLLPAPTSQPDPSQAAAQALRQHLQQFLWQLRQQSPTLA